MRGRCVGGVIVVSYSHEDCKIIHGIRLYWQENDRMALEKVNHIFFFRFALISFVVYPRTGGCDFVTAGYLSRTTECMDSALQSCVNIVECVQVRKRRQYSAARDREHHTATMDYSRSIIVRRL